MTVTAFASGGTAGGDSLGLCPRCSEVCWVTAGRDGALGSCWEPTLGPTHSGSTFRGKQTNENKAMKYTTLVTSYYSFQTLASVFRGSFPLELFCNKQVTLRDHSPHGALVGSHRLDGQLVLLTYQGLRPVSLLFT